VADSRPADIAQFVADANANAPIVVAVAGKEVIGILSRESATTTPGFTWLRYRRHGVIMVSAQQ